MAISATQKWYAGAGVASVAVLAAGWFLLVSPQQNNAADLVSQADAAVAHNTVTQGQIEGLKKEFANLPALQGQVAAIRVRIPANPSEPSLLRALSEAAKASGVRLVAVRAQVPAPITAAGAPTTPGTNLLAAPGGIAQIPLGIDVTGSFSATRLFFNAVENMQREILVTNVDIKRGQDSSGIATTVTAKAFIANPGSFAAANAPATTTPGTAGANAAS